MDRPAQLDEGGRLTRVPLIRPGAGDPFDDARLPAKATILFVS